MTARYQDLVGASEPLLAPATADGTARPSARPSTPPHTPVTGVAGYDRPSASTHRETGAEGPMTRTGVPQAGAREVGGPGAASRGDAGPPASILEGFAGPGGFSEALRMLGAGSAVGIETGIDACATARAAGHQRLQVDIRTLDPADFPTVTRWISGPPCPTFSASGKRSGLGDYEIVLDGCALLGDAQANTARDHDYLAACRRVADQRSALVLETLRFAFRLPGARVVVAEQVPAVQGIWETAAAELAAAHDFHSCHVLTLRADDFGAPTRRTRVFLIACREDEPDLSGLPIRRWWSCGRYEPPRWRAPFPVTPFPLISMAEALGWPAGVRVNTRGDRKTPGGNEFSADHPAPGLTYTARSWYRTDLGPVDGRLEAWQAGVMQGFPADYPWHGSRTSRFQQAADAVPPLMGAAVLGAALGLPWQEPVWRRLAELYGHVAEVAA